MNELQRKLAERRSKMGEELIVGHDGVKSVPATMHHPTTTQPPAPAPAPKAAPYPVAQPVQKPAEQPKSAPAPVQQPPPPQPVHHQPPPQPVAPPPAPVEQPKPKEPIFAPPKQPEPISQPPMPPAHQPPPVHHQPPPPQPAPQQPPPQAHKPSVTHKPAAPTGGPALDYSNVDPSKPVRMMMPLPGQMKPQAEAGEQAPAGPVLAQVKQAQGEEERLIAELRAQAQAILGKLSFNAEVGGAVQFPTTNLRKSTKARMFKTIAQAVRTKQQSVLFFDQKAKLAGGLEWGRESDAKLKDHIRREAKRILKGDKKADTPWQESMQEKNYEADKEGDRGKAPSFHGPPVPPPPAPAPPAPVSQGLPPAPVPPGQADINIEPFYATASQKLKTNLEQKAKEMQFEACIPIRNKIQELDDLKSKIDKETNPANKAKLKDDFMKLAKAALAS